MPTPKEEHPESTSVPSSRDMSDDRQQQAYIEERIRLGLAEQTRVRAQWEAEDRAKQQVQSQWKRRIWVIAKVVGVWFFAFTCMVGWVLTLWQPPSAEVAINYLCVIGMWMIGIKFARWCSPFSPSGWIWRPIFLVGSFSLVMGAQLWFDHYRVEYQYDNGARVTERWGRVHSLWNHRRVSTPDNFSSLLSMDGPITRSGSRHGKWIFQYSSLPSKFKWYWQDEEVSEQEWRKRVEGTM